MAHYGEVIDELEEPTRSLSEMSPGTWRGQRGAIDSHVSQGTDSAALARRLALQGPLERVRRAARLGATSR